MEELLSFEKNDILDVEIQEMIVGKKRYAEYKGKFSGNEIASRTVRAAMSINNLDQKYASIQFLYDICRTDKNASEAPSALLQLERQYRMLVFARNQFSFVRVSRENNKRAIPFIHHDNEKKDRKGYNNNNSKTRYRWRKVITALCVDTDDAYTASLTGIAKYSIETTAAKTITSIYRHLYPHAPISTFVALAFIHRNVVVGMDESGSFYAFEQDNPQMFVANAFAGIAAADNGALIEQAQISRSGCVAAVFRDAKNSPSSSQQTRRSYECKDTLCCIDDISKPRETRRLWSVTDMMLDMLNKDDFALDSNQKHPQEIRIDCVATCPSRHVSSSCIAWSTTTTANAAPRHHCLWCFCPNAATPCFIMPIPEGLVADEIQTHRHQQDEDIGDAAAAASSSLLFHNRIVSMTWQKDFQSGQQFLSISDDHNDDAHQPQRLAAMWKNGMIVVWSVETTRSSTAPTVSVLLHTFLQNSSIMDNRIAVSSSPCQQQQHHCCRIAWWDTTICVASTDGSLLLFMICGKTFSAGALAKKTAIPAYHTNRGKPLLTLFNNNNNAGSGNSTSGSNVSRIAMPESLPILETGRQGLFVAIGEQLWCLPWNSIIQ